jgi:hypothetical protein
MIQPAEPHLDPAPAPALTWEPNRDGVRCPLDAISGSITLSSPYSLYTTTPCV